MRVRKRNGDLEPVDLNKIVRAVARCAAGLDGVDPMRVATRTISGLYDGATTTELDELSIRTAAALIGEEPNYSPARRAPARHVHRQGGGEPGHPLVLAVDRGRPRRRPDRRRHRRSSSPPTPASSTTPSTPTATGCSSTSACAPSTTATCCATPSAARSSRRRSTSSCASPAACRTTPEEAIELYRLDLLARVPAVHADAVQLGHDAPADVVAATCSTRRPTSSTPSTTATPTSPGSRSSPAASASPSTASAPAAR